MLKDKNGLRIFISDTDAKNYFDIDSKKELCDILKKLNLKYLSDLQKASSLDIIFYIENYLSKHDVDLRISEEINQELRCIEKNLINIYNTFKENKHFMLADLKGKPVVRKCKLTPVKTISPSSMVPLEKRLSEILSQNDERHIFGEEIAGNQRCL